MSLVVILMLYQLDLSGLYESRCDPPVTVPAVHAGPADH